MSDERERESELSIKTSGQEIKSEACNWSNFSREEKFFAGLLYTHLVIAPIANTVIYAGVAAWALYKAFT